MIQIKPEVRRVGEDDVAERLSRCADGSPGAPSRKPLLRLALTALALAAVLPIAVAPRAIAATQSEETLNPGVIEPSELDTAAPSPFEASPPPAPEALSPTADVPPVIEEPEPVAPTQTTEAPPAAAPEPALELDTPPAQVAEPAEPAFEEPAPVVVEKKREEPPAKKLARREREKVLESPTKSIELYEKVRRDHMWERTRPEWSVNLALAPRAFGRADLRVPLTNAGNDSKPRLTGVILGGERVLLTTHGQLQVGGEFGFFGAARRDNFSSLLGAVMTLGPYVQYEGLYFNRQIVVPTVKAGYEVARVNYTYKNTKVNDVRAMPRIDLGALVYLNFLEPRSAGLMETNYGVKRTYLAVYYSLASDPTKKDIDLSERGSWRAGFRFEF